MAKEDYYKVLGIDRDSGADDVKKAYRKRAMQYHPDRNPGDAEAEKKFKELNEANDVLSDEQKRAAYDRFGHDAFEQGGAGGGAGFGPGFGSGFADIFDEMFGDFAGRGGGRGGRRASRGADLRYNMEITLAQAYNGAKTNIRVPASVQCKDCSGIGSKGGAQPDTCPACHGHGSVRAQQGFFTIERTCPTCQGQGKVIKEACPACSGSGRTQQEKTLAVTIPAGVEDGTRIRLAGEGEAGMQGAAAGDLYIFISVATHRIFNREGPNIYCKVPIPITIAALGGQIEVPTVDGGRARITIPAGTQSGHQFRLKTKGMSVLRSKGRGDMFVQANVETPVNLSKRQKELLREFDAESGGAKNNPQSEGFFSKVKDLWEDLKD
ncbi:MAG: molecular chaperone DnaJ [Rhodospirillales bacterium]|nr:molecular chaperone DnaJ [Rhodospirillales bacterium]